MVVSGRARRRARAARVVELRGQGLSYREIGERVGVAACTVMRDLRLGVSERLPVVAAGPGNVRAVSHGAHSDVLVRPRAVELVPEVFGANRHLDERRDGSAVWRYALLLARIERAHDWLGGQPDALFSDVESGTVHPLYGRLRDWERQASSDEERLAIAPLTRARLGLDLLEAEGRRSTLEDFIGPVPGRDGGGVE